jgi:hypothetical protein
LALDASIQYVEHIMEEGQFTELDKRVLLGINGGVLAFAMDTTTNTPKVLRAMQDQVISIARARRGTNDEPLSYIVTEISDAKPTTQETSDFDVFVRNVRQLKHRGTSTNCSKLLYTSIIDALQSVKGAGSLVAFTDADASDGHRRSEAENLANKHNMQIHVINHPVGNCKPIRSLDITNHADTFLSSDLSPLAKASGGTSFALTGLESTSFNTLLEELSQVSPLLLLSVSGNIKSDTPVSYDLPLDTTMEGLTVFLGGLGTTVSLFRPDGSLSESSHAEETLKPSYNLRTLQLNSPTPGIWRAVVSGVGSFQLRVQSSSSLRLKTFEFVETKGRPGHKGYFKIDGHPESGRNVTIFAKVIGNFTEAKFSFKEANGEHVVDIPMVAGSGKLGSPPQNHFVGTLQLPTRELIAYVSGTDDKGAPFQRVYPRVFHPMPSFQPGT